MLSRDTSNAYLHADLYWPILGSAAFHPVHPLSATEDLDYHTLSEAPQSV